MGAFYDSAQIRTDGATDRAELVTAIRELLTSDGRYEQIDAADGAHRSVVLGPPGRWTAVYDEGDESTKLAGALSMGLDEVAVGVHLHDSDVVMMELFDRGDAVDSYNSRPDYFEPPPPEGDDHEEATYDGDPQLWSELLVDGVTVEDLDAAFGGDDLFAEAILGRVVDLFGWEKSDVFNSYGYLEPTDEHLSLHFRLTEQPAYEKKAEGPPGFQREAYTPHMDLTVGDEDHIRCSFRSIGAASTGVAVAVWGDAVDDGIVSLGEATVRWPDDEDFIDKEAAFEAIEVPSKVLLAKLDDVEVPAGLADPHGDGADPSMWRRAMKASFAAQLSVIVPITVESAGDTVLHLGLVPLENPQDRQATVSVSLSVTGELRRPLRDAGNENSHYLRTMNDASHLVAMVVLDADRQAVASEAADAFERWHELTGSDAYRKSVTPGPQKASKTGKLAGKSIPEGARWRKLRDQMETAPRVSLEGAGDAPLDAVVPDKLTTGACFAFIEPSTWFEGRDDRPCLHVSLSVGISDEEGEQVERLHTELTEIVDHLMNHAGGVQAFIARWNWMPTYSIDSTPYEGACGVAGQCTGGVSWASRYLRAATPWLWLGSELAERVDQHKLGEIASLEPVGDAMRVTLLPEASLDDLEDALAPLLPDADDWRAGVDTLYGRD